MLKYIKNNCKQWQLCNTADTTDAFLWHIFWTRIKYSNGLANLCFYEEKQENL